MSRRLSEMVCSLLGMGLVIAVLPEAAHGGDVFGTQSQVSPGPATPLLHDAADPCPQTPVSKPLPLFEAIERSLCESPKTHAAWATVKEAAADVGQSKAAYLPTLDGTVGYSASHEDTEVKGHPELHSSFSQPVNSQTLSLGWLLYDFGGRAAVLRRSKDLEAAAQANQSMVLQAVFANTAKDYYTAQAAHAAVQAAGRIESDARQTLDAADARYKSGVAPVTDQLQANTLFTQAVYLRARAEGAERIALGILATDMSLATDAPLDLPELDQSVLPDTSFVHTVHDLIDEAMQSHASILASRAQWKSAMEDVRVARAEGLPKVSLAGSASRVDQPLSASLGQPEFPALSHQSSIGLSVQIPIFQGFSWEYKIRQAQARVESDAQALRDTQQQVSVGVWTNFQALQTATESVHNTETVLQSARESFNAYEHRYRSGLSGILDVLNAQTTLAIAEQQQIEAQFDWRTARIQLAQSLGQLGLWAVQ